MNKLTELRNLVSKRRESISGTLETNYSRDYLKLGDFHNGGYDFDDHVVPYSKSAFNLNAKIMIVLQDWASENFLNRPINEVQKQLDHSSVAFVAHPHACQLMMREERRREACVSVTGGMHSHVYPHTAHDNAHSCRD